jgi:hypothetical protein
MNRIFFSCCGLLASIAWLEVFAQTTTKTSVQSAAGGSARAGSFTLNATATGQPSSPGRATAGRFTLLSGYLYTLAKPAGNRPPVVTNAIASQILTVGGRAFTRDLREVFADPDGDALIYTASSSNVNIATASISENMLTVTPVAAGMAVITVTANDRRGGLRATTFNVAVITLTEPITRDTPKPATRLTLAVTPPQNFQPAIGRLFYRLAGQRSYQFVDLSLIGNQFEGTIPAAFVTIRGLEYYVLLSDGQTVVTFPATDPENNPAIIQVQIDRVDYQLPLAAKRYQMISMPLALNDPGIDAVLADDYGKYQAFPRQWRLYRWQNNDYAEHFDINASFTPGAAFWLVIREAKTFDAENAQSVNSAQPFAIMLQPGWNQIANPFAFPVAWDSVQGASGQVQAPVQWNGEDYMYNQTTLEPWEGYFVFNLSSSTVTLSVPPRESEIETGKAADWPLLSENEFILQIKARGLKSGWKDEQNFVGMLAGATDEPERLDFLEAPPIGDYIRLSITDEGYTYAGNFRAISENGGFWDLQISTTNGKENVRLTFTERPALPAHFQIWMLDKDRQRSLPIAHGQVELEIPSKGSTKPLRLIAGTPELANQANAGIPLAPYQFALHQNYPNPFNPETRIEYELAERVEVQLEVYNILGQKVRTLVNAVQMAGQYVVEWDGHDQNEKPVASGVYLYRLKAGELVAVRKLVLSH